MTLITMAFILFIFLKLRFVPTQRVIVPITVPCLTVIMMALDGQTLEASSVKGMREGVTKKGPFFFFKKKKL